MAKKCRQELLKAGISHMRDCDICDKGPCPQGVGPELKPETDIKGWINHEWTQEELDDLRKSLKEAGKGPFIMEDKRTIIPEPQSVAMMELNEFLYAEATVRNFVAPDVDEAAKHIRSVLLLHRYTVLNWLMQSGVQIPVDFLTDQTHTAVGEQSVDKPVPKLGIDGNAAHEPMRTQNREFAAPPTYENPPLDVTSIMSESPAKQIEPTFKEQLKEIEKKEGPITEPLYEHPRHQEFMADDGQGGILD